MLENPLDWPLINALYRECSNLSAIESLGLQPVQAIFTKIDALPPMVCLGLRAPSELSRNCCTNRSLLVWSWRWS